MAAGAAIRKWPGCWRMPPTAGRITPEEALLLYHRAPLPRARRGSGRGAPAPLSATTSSTYIIDRNINYTNVCVTACRFCAFYRPPKHPEGWVRDLDEILRRCGEAVELGATQIMLQGGHHPEFGVEWYEETFAAIKAAYPQLALHSLGRQRGRAHVQGVGARPSSRSIRRLHAAGLDSFAGAGAEILVAAPAAGDRPAQGVRRGAGSR